MEKSLIKIANLINQRTGIIIGPSNYENIIYKLKDEVSKRSNGDWNDYADLVNYSPSAFQDLINALTIGETFFFREEKQIELLLEMILDSKQRKFVIWSAGCSVGAEPYSIAMYLLAAGISNFQVIATDINSVFLEIAKQGKYPIKSHVFRGEGTDYIKRFFEKKGDFLQISERVKEKVFFQQYNLIDDVKFWLPKMDFIFCRNVLIYFDKLTTKRVIDSFFDCLVNGGKLFLGHSESLFRLSNKFQMKNINGVTYYEKNLHAT